MQPSRLPTLARLRPAGIADAPLARDDRRKLLRASVVLSVLYCAAIIALTTVIRGVLEGESYGLTPLRAGLFVLAEALILLISFMLL